MGKEATIAVIDGGGRGDTLVKRYAESPHVGKVFAIPGNDMMPDGVDKEVRIFPELKTTSVEEIVEIALENRIELVDVAQDNAIAVGLVDRLRAVGIPTIGPTSDAGLIESSKVWARINGREFNLPQPEFHAFDSEGSAIEFLEGQADSKWFIKADGLAEGKGALPAEDNQEAIERVKELRESFPEAAKQFLIESWMPGEEFSTFILSDGTSHVMIGSAQDHKRAYDGDQGPNTGGMGCSSPPLVLTEELLREVDEKIFARVIAGLNKVGRAYKGVLYLGGMKDHTDGQPKVVEFNGRWGDPEVQVVLPGIKNDLFEMSQAVVEGNLDRMNIQLDGKARVVVAGASKGYPGDYSAVKGRRIFGLDKAREMSGVRIYGAGVKKEGNIYRANGGRLFYVVGEGEDVIEAQKKAYDAMSLISVEDDGLHFRTDIGWRDVKRLGRDGRT